MIDKTSAHWHSLPLLFRLNFIGSGRRWTGLSERRYWVRGEQQLGRVGLLMMPFGILDSGMIHGGIAMVILTYGLSLVTRAGDRHGVWERWSTPRKLDSP